MGNQTFLERLREWIGGIGFDVFLWSIRMTEEEYINIIQSDGMQDAAIPDTCPSCAGEKQVIGEDGTVWVCGICGGTGRRL